MRIRAVIFDVYHTLLEVGPPLSDSVLEWEALWHERFGAPARLSLADFATSCDAIIASEHAAARLAGVEFPEIYWPAVASQVLPELARLTADARDEFLFRHAQMVRSVRLAPAAAGTLQLLRDARVQLGIASNGQPYTVRELDAALANQGESLGIFNAALCFWSFDHGFSKPDPHVFRVLASRLRAKEIRDHETLMIGDRLDNDIRPAAAHGWQTWHLNPEPSAAMGGDWNHLARWLAASC